MVGCCGGGEGVGGGYLPWGVTSCGGEPPLEGGVRGEIGGVGESANWWCWASSRISSSISWSMTPG